MVVDERAAPPKRGWSWIRRCLERQRGRRCQPNNSYPGAWFRPDANPGVTSTATDRRWSHMSLPMCRSNCVSVCRSSLPRVSHSTTAGRAELDFRTPANNDWPR